MEVGVIKKLLDNYLTIVKKNIADSVPKAVTHIAYTNHKPTNNKQQNKQHNTTKHKHTQHTSAQSTQYEMIQLPHDCEEEHLCRRPSRASHTTLEYNTTDREVECRIPRLPSAVSSRRFPEIFGDFCKIETSFLQALLENRSLPLSPIDFPRKPESVPRIQELSSCRPRENMVGVDMVLAQYPNNTLYHRIYIIHDLI